MPRLLVVDDEPALLELLRKYLERLGYQVDACASPGDALRIFSQNPAAYHLVLTDLSFDGMNGEQMLAEMRKHAPELRAIVSSGYPWDPAESKTWFMLKPYAPKMLAELIAKVLAGG